MKLERRLAKLEGSLPQPQELPPVPEDLREALRAIGGKPGKATSRPVSVPPLSPELRAALRALSTNLLKKRCCN
jgi:hypothetical protein